MKNLYEYVEENIDNMDIEDVEELLLSVISTLKIRKEENVKSLYKLYTNNNNLIGSNTYFSKLNDYNDFMVMYDAVCKYYGIDNE